MHGNLYVCMEEPQEGGKRGLLKQVLNSNVKIVFFLLSYVTVSFIKMGKSFLLIVLLLQLLSTIVRILVKLE